MAPRGSGSPRSGGDTLAIDTINGTSWGPLANYLAGGALAADLVLMQEHHLHDARTADEEQWARSCKWKASLEAAITNAGTVAPGGGPGTSGGVGIASPAHRGLAKFKQGLHAEPAAAPGQMIFRHWGAVEKGGITVVSV